MDRMDVALAPERAKADAPPKNAECAGPVSWVPVSALLSADSPRLTGESAEHIRALAESGTVLPPIIVHRSTMRVIDGMHRLRAARLRGQTEIEVQFADGDAEDMFVLAVQLNTRHGLPLTLADRKAAADRILASHARWSDRRIASVTALSPSTVGALRRRLTDQIGHSDIRLGRDGTDRPLSAAAGRALASDLLTERPDAPIREIASIAGIAPSTAHDVRRRLREGRQPVPASQPASAVRTRLPSAGAVPAAVSSERAEVAMDDLRTDPALRFTDAGRALLRLLSAQSILRDQSAQLAAIVPPHLVAPMATQACRIGDAWHEFANQLEHRPLVRQL